MSDYLFSQYQSGYAAWNSADSLPIPDQKLQAMAKASGHFATVLQSRDLDSTVIGTIGFFYYQYTALLAQNRRDHEAERYYKLTHDVANRALKEDSSELYARFTLFCIAVTELPEKPKATNLLGSLFDPNKSMFKKTFNASSQLTEYNICKGRVEKAVENLRVSFANQLVRGIDVQLCDEMIRRILDVLPALPEHGISSNALCTTLLSARDHVEKMVTSLTGDEVTQALESLDEALDMVHGYVNINKLTSTR